MKTQFLSLSCMLLGAVAGIHAATLEVDPGRSRIQVDANATGHGFTGNLEKFVANISGDGNSLAPSSFDLDWNFQDLKTAEPDRDAEMIKWLGGGKPKGSFKFVKSWTDGKGATNAQGTLTIHGVSKTIAFPYSVKKEGEWFTIDGKASMDYQNFGLPIVRAMALMTVDPKLMVRFHIVGKIK